MSDGKDFRSKYGPWAFVAGGSEGLGGAFADALAQRGLNLVLIARRPEILRAKADELHSKYGVQVRAVSVDLGSPDLLHVVERETAGLEVGMLVLNAALATVSPFLDMSLEDELKKLDINCRSTVMLSHYFGGKMAGRKRGGIVVMSSGAGLLGMPYVAVYSATKSFEINFAEALWFELGQHNVDVMACVAGLTKTPQIVASHPELKNQSIGSYMEPEEVVAEVLEKLGTRPSMAPGGRNKFSRFLFTRLLPRKLMIRMTAKHHVDNFMSEKEELS